MTQARYGRVEIVLTTFETAREYLEEINSVAWQLVVADECHKIKEKGSALTKALKSLRCLKRIGLTGTALQNKYEELWCLLDWANPGCLGTSEHFKSSLSRPMVKGFRQDATSNELANAREKQEKFNTEKLQWMLRRTKASEIADKLPTKIDQVVFCGLSKFQHEVFKFLLALPEVKSILTAYERCPCGKKRARHLCCEKPEKPLSVQLLQTMAVFLKAANHASLLLPDNTNSLAQAELGEEICRGVVQKFPELKETNFLNLSNPRYSGKMEVLAGLLTILESEGAKVLLFSYSTSLLNIIETYIESKGYSYCRLDGSTRVGARQEMVNTFNKDQGLFLFLLSTKAGGLGLNITGANTVIIFDPNWNPSHDMQAQDRAYRLGQTRDVKIFRLISAGCIEEIIYLRQLYKQQLAANSVDGCTAKRLFTAVQGDKKRKGELFGIKNLLSVRVSALNKSCLTENIEKRHSDIEKKILRKSRVALSVEEFELEDPVVEAENTSKDPYQIGLDLDLDLQEESDEVFYGGVVYTHSNDQVVGGSKEEEMISRLAQRSAGTKEGSKVANEISCEDLPALGEEGRGETDLTDLGRTQLQDSLSQSETVTPPAARVLPISSPAELRADPTPEADQPLVSSSSPKSEDEVFQRPQRPLKLAPEGVFFKKRKRTHFESDQNENELDEIFPSSKLAKLKSDQNKKIREVKKKSYFLDETIDDIFG